MRRKYRAFISYSHADEVWGRKLHRTLERYFTPRALHGTEGRDGPVPKRIFPIFRDREELPTSSDLGGVISQALEDSDYLIVICSPRSAASKWVNEEILTFKRLGRSNRVMCLIVDGEPNGSDIQGKEPLECFPEAIRFEIGADGALTTERAEPIAADVREGKDGWRNAWMKLAAGVLGVDYDALKQRDLTRRRKRGALWAAAAAAMIAAGGFGVWKEREARLAQELEAARVEAMRAHSALDQGDEKAALAAVVTAFPASPNFEAGAPPVPPEAITALNRVAFETRLLADYPAPAGAEVAYMRLLPEGALAIVEDGGRTHLVDPGTGEATTVYDPARWTHTRISADGSTLWTAHFEEERRDEDGEWYAPLLFEEAELATGEVRLATAVKSVAAYGGDAEISPDGAFFAVDLGPGEGENTVIAVFEREAQALAGVLTLPSDRADIRFVDKDHILAEITSPSPWGNSPGLYLWRVGDERPLMLRETGAPPTCREGEDPADRDAIRLTIAPDGREVGLFIGAFDTACVRRWSLPDGTPLPTVQITDDGGDWAASLRSGGPYVFGTDYGVPMMTRSGSSALLRGCGKGPFSFLQSGEDDGGGSARGALFCGDRDDAALHFGPSGELRWSGAAHQGGIRALAHDAENRRLFTIGADARLKIWDTAPHSSGVARTAGELRLIAGAGQTVAILSEDRTVRLLTTAGDPIGKPVRQPHPGGVKAVPLAGETLGFFTFTQPGFGQSDGVGEANRFTVIDAATGETTAAFTGLRSLRGKQPKVSADHERFLLITATGGAIWGDGATGRSLSDIDLGEDQPIFRGDVAGRRFALITSNGEWDDPEKRFMRLFTGGDDEAPTLRREWKGQSAEVRLSSNGRHALVEVGRVPPAKTTLYLVDLTSDDVSEIAVGDYSATWFGFSPDGGHIHYSPGSASSAQAGGVKIQGPTVFTLDGDIALALPPFDFLSDEPQWSPGGGYVAHGGGPLRIYEADSGIEICPGLTAEKAEHIVFSPGETRIAFQRPWGDGGDGVEVFDLATCTPLRRIGAETTFTMPLFIDEDTLWLPLDGEVAEVPLTLDSALTLDAIRKRARRLGVGQGG